MALFDNFYSRWIASVKIVLPLVALGILSTMFFLSRSPDADLTLLQPGTGTGLGESLTKPNYVGTTDDGSAITIEAEMLEPSTSRPNFIEGEKVATRIETERGGIIDVSAISSEIDLARNNMTLIGDVTIVTSSGIFVETEKLMAKLDVTYAEATSQIDAQSPIGSLTAGSMTLKLKPDGTYVLDFKNGVNLLYEPKG